MKFIFICILNVFLAVSSANANMESFLAASDSCEKEMPGLMETIGKCSFTQCSMEHKCLLKCLMEKDGILKNGSFDAEYYIENNKVFFPNHLLQLREGAEKCKNISKSDDCETAYQLRSCLAEPDMLN
ncbi:general odorant-binding protein 56h-like [Haematobia irritans]|uniref:general odorant-binding protein 56h-like n=1 Tax=Haematobia irritans TaxID=7368 RepID=UPI003F505622